MNLSDVFLGRPDLLDDEKKLKSVFADYFASDTAKINRMMKAYEVGVLDTLKKEKPEPFEKQMLIDRLVNQHDMQENKATEAVEEWFAIANKAVIKAYREYLNTKKSEKEEKQKQQEKQIQIELNKAQKAREDQKILDSKAGNLNLDYDDYERYMNLDLAKGDIVRGIPCGVGDSDYGFIVKGTGTEDVNKNELYPSLHALVYNFLIRDSHIKRENYPQYMKTHFFNHELDYGRVYRYMMILLDLLNPTGKTVLRLNILGDKDEVTAAVDILNEYLAVFSRLIKDELCQLEVIDDPTGKTISAESKANYYVKNLEKDCGLRRRPGQVQICV